MNTIIAEPGARPELTIVKEQAESSIRFNVMPDRPVEETLHIREYRVGPSYIEARFDRSYHSSMLKSPSHLIFLTVVMHLQKMIYIYACHQLELGYDPYGPERLKVWPTNVEVEMPRMIRDEDSLVHRVYVDEFDRLGFKRHHIRVHSDVNGLMHINGQAPIFVL